MKCFFPTLPSPFAPFILAFASLFSPRVWRQAQVLLVGALLARGPRTVASALRAVGLGAERHFQNYHRVLNRTIWSSLRGSRILLSLLIQHLVPHGPVVLGIDDTIERRWGPQIKARGIYRDPVRSSHSHLVKASGLRWISLMLLAPIPWAGRVWALPFLTALAPSEHYCQQYRHRHKKLTDWARQLLLQTRRWLPHRQLVMVGDGAFAALDLLARLVAAPPFLCVTRLRLDARLYQPPPPRRSGRPGRPRIVGRRLPSLKQVLIDPATVWTRLRISNWYGQGPRFIELASGVAIWYHGGLPPVSLRWVLLRDPQGRFDSQALLCTDANQKPLQILQWFQMRWQVEVTFQEVRTHLGVETQRQWSDLAIARTTPILLGFFSLVTLLAGRLCRGSHLPVRHTAWYRKQQPTFSDALAAVRSGFWRQTGFSLSPPKNNLVKIPRSFFRCLHDALCYAA
jgi:DDE superfamily endonuclease